MLLGAMQRRLAEVYGLETRYDIYDFLITDRQMAQTLGGAGRPVDEELLIGESEEGAHVSLFLEQSLLDRLDRNDPDRCLDAVNLGDFLTAFEGVSHFTYFAYKASRDRPVSRLELELQAEVDKFVVTARMCRENRGGSPDILHRLLFEAPRLLGGLSAQERDRYEHASRYAGRYCRRLWPALRRNDWAGPLMSEIRHFYRLDRRQKFGHIDSGGRPGLA